VKAPAWSAAAVGISGGIILDRKLDIRHGQSFLPAGN